MPKKKNTNRILIVLGIILILGIFLFSGGNTEKREDTTNGNNDNNTIPTEGEVQIDTSKPSYSEDIIDGSVGVKGVSNLEGVRVTWIPITATPQYTFTGPTGTYAMLNAKRGPGILEFYKEGYKIFRFETVYEGGLRHITVNLVKS